MCTYEIAGYSVLLFIEQIYKQIANESFFFGIYHPNSFHKFHLSLYNERQSSLHRHSISLVVVLQIESSLAGAMSF